MDEKTQKLKSMQDKIHSLLKEVNEFKEEFNVKPILMNLTNTSKELNSMIISSIVGNLEEKGE